MPSSPGGFGQGPSDQGGFVPHVPGLNAVRSGAYCAWNVQWDGESGGTRRSLLALTSRGPSGAEHLHPDRGRIVQWAKDNAVTPGYYSVYMQCVDAQGNPGVEQNTDGFPVGADASAPGMPGYVGVNLGPSGRPYYKVLDEHATAVGGALNNFTITERNPDDTVVATRVAGVGDLASSIAAERAGRGIILRGDVFTDDAIAVGLTNTLDGLSEADGVYVLAAPDVGWQTGVDESWLGHQIKRASLGMRWGALIGGAAALTIVGLHAMKTRGR